MNSKTAGYFRKLTDSNGQYIWQQSLALGNPATINGYKMMIDENVPDIAAGAVPIMFGDFKSGYLTVDRTPLRVLRDPYTNKPYVHFYSTKRVSGMVTDSNAIRLFKMAAA